MSAEIRIECASDARLLHPDSRRDHLNFADDDGQILATMQGDVYLDEERARKLFNWLGVWLVGGNRE